MKSPEDLLQERLEQLETGTPLAQCQQGLTAEEISLLLLASQLRLMNNPARVPQKVHQQRARLIQIAQKGQKVKSGRAIFQPHWTFSPAGIVAAAAFLILCVAAATLASTTYVTHQQNQNLTVINTLDGVVEIEINDTWTDIAAATTVKVGQHIRTAPSATALLALPDGSLVYLGSATEIWIKQLEAQDGQRAIRLAQWSGETRHDVAPATVAYSSYEVETPTGISEAKRTIFSIFVPSNEQTRVTVLEGTVEVNGTAGHETVAAGKMTTLNLNQPPQTPSFVVIGEGTFHHEANYYQIAGQTFMHHSGTVIAPGIQEGTVVYVEGHIGSDGVYYADNITTGRGTAAFLGDQFTTGITTTPGEKLACVTIASTVIAHNGTQITLEGNSSVDLEQLTVLEGTPALNSSVLLITCQSEAGNALVTILVVLVGPSDAATPSPMTPVPIIVTATPGNNGMVTLCHIPAGKPENSHTIMVGAAAVSAHLAHGDTLGPCDVVATPTATTTPTLTPTATLTPTLSHTPSATPTPLASATEAPMPTFTPVPTPTPAPTATETLSSTSTLTPTPIPIPTITITPTAGITITTTLPATVTFTATPNITRTATPSPMPTRTPTLAPTWTPTSAPTPSPTTPPTPTPGYPGLIVICHIPPGNPGNAYTIHVTLLELPYHLAHGDTLGPCLP